MPSILLTHTPSVPVETTGIRLVFQKCESTEDNVPSVLRHYTRFDVLVENEPVDHRSVLRWSDGGQLPHFGDGPLVTLPDALHLIGITVIVGKRLVDVSDVQIVPFCYPLGSNLPLLDVRMYVSLISRS